MNDYISRDELLELYASDPDCDKGSVPFPVVRQNILDMPAVDVAPIKHGHWNIEVSKYTGYRNKYTCSECGYSKMTDTHVSLGYNYCPKCGAKMEEET